MHNIINLTSELSIGYFIHLPLLLLQHEESNPGTKNKQINKLSCCHWNVNSLLAQNLFKISQIEAYSSLYHHDFIWISETYFDLTILEGDKSFHLKDHNFLRTDHPNNKKPGVCIYYKDLGGSCEVKLSDWSQCIICEVS